MAFTNTNPSPAVRLASGGGGGIAWDDLMVVTNYTDFCSVVTTTLDNDNGSASGGTSLREAIKYSSSGMPITFAYGLSGQTVSLSGSPITVNKDIFMDASNLPAGMSIDGGQGTNRLFAVEPGKHLTLSGLTLTGGKGGGGAGGAIHNAGTVTLEKCTLIGNSAPGSNGGALHNAGTMILSQCTLTGNSSMNGGAISNGSMLTLTHCTLSGNSASLNGGGTFNEGTLLLSNTILAGNTAPSGPDLLHSIGTITPGGVNLIGDLMGSALTAGPTLLIGNPKLSPLGYFGGPTQTMHPLIGSPVIDAGSNTDPGGTDQRGLPRFVDGHTASEGAQLDLGAVEAGPLAMVTSAADTLEAGTLRSALSSATQGARIGFIPTVFPGAQVRLGGSELPIPTTATIFIDASNLSGPVTISGNNTSRVFNIAAGANVAMHRLTITGGKVPENDTFGLHGGGLSNQGDLSLFVCSITNNRAKDSNGSGGGSGGGIYSNGRISLESCTVSGNGAGNPAGGFVSPGGIIF